MRRIRRRTGSVRTISRRLDDRGVTLVELLITIAIMAIAVLAVVGAVATLLMGTATHRSSATADTIARDYAEAVRVAVAKQWTAAGGCKNGYGVTVPSGMSAPAYGSCPGASAPQFQSVTVVVKLPRDSETLQFVVGMP